MKNKANRSGASAVTETGTGGLALTGDVDTDAKAVYDAAGTVQQDFDAAMEDVADRLGLDYEAAGQKSLESIRNKVIRKQAAGEDYSVLQMKDHTRGKLELQDFGQINDVLDILDEKNIPYSTEAVGPTEWGYRGFHVTWRDAAGIGSELQLTRPDVWQVKLWSDSIYDKWRNVDAKALTPEQLSDYLNDLRLSNETWNGLDLPDFTAWESSASDRTSPSMISDRGMDDRTGTQAPLSNSRMPFADVENMRPDSVMQGMTAPPSTENSIPVSGKNVNSEQSRPMTNAEIMAEVATRGAVERQQIANAHAFADSITARQRAAQTAQTAPDGTFAAGGESVPGTTENATAVQGNNQAGAGAQPTPGNERPEMSYNLIKRDIAGLGHGTQAETPGASYPRSNGNISNDSIPNPGEKVNGELLRLLARKEELGKKEPTRENKREYNRLEKAILEETVRLYEEDAGFAEKSERLTQLMEQRKEALKAIDEADNGSMRQNRFLERQTIEGKILKEVQRLYVNRENAKPLTNAEIMAMPKAEREKTTGKRKASPESIAHVAERVMKNGIVDVKHRGSFVLDGEQYVTDGYRLIRFREPMELTQAGELFSGAKDAAARQNNLAKVLKQDAQNETRVELPAVKDLRAGLTAAKRQEKNNLLDGWTGDIFWSRANTKVDAENYRYFYDFGEDKPLVNAQYLVDMLSALPDSEAYVDEGNTSRIYFKAENGDGILLPMDKDFFYDGLHRPKRTSEEALAAAWDEYDRIKAGGSSMSEDMWKHYMRQMAWGGTLPEDVSRPGTKATTAETSEAVDDYLHKEHHGKILDVIRENLYKIENMDSVADLTGSEFQKTPDDDRSLKKKVIDFFNGIGNKVYREGFGDITLNNRGANESLEHGYGRYKAASFASLPKVLQNGKVVYYDPHFQGRNYESYIIAAPINIGPERCYVGALVIKDANTQRYKVHEVLTMKKDGTQPIQLETTDIGSDSETVYHPEDSITNPDENFNPEMRRDGLGAADVGSVDPNSLWQMEAGEYYPVNERAAAETLETRGRVPFDMPTKDMHGARISRQAATLANAKMTTNEMAGALETEARHGTFSYIEYSDAEAMAKAETRISGEGWDRAFGAYEEAVKSGKTSKDTTALGIALYNSAVNGGVLVDAMDVASLMVQNSRNAAQGPGALPEKYQHFFRAFLNWTENRMAVKVTATVSAMGSARYTPMVLSAVRWGTRYIRGRSRTNFRTTATMMEHPALPMETKVIWQAVWMPNRNMAAQ